MNAPVHDIDPQETQEWQDALEAIIAHEGRERAQYLLRRLIDQAQIAGVETPYSATTPYQNTIPTELEARPESNPDIEEHLQAIVRWNAIAMVLKANKESSELGGHIASYASSALLYEVGFNHFWHAPHNGHLGDMIYFQGHSAPGVYSRAFLEGRLTEAQLLNFRQEAAGRGLSSYPHPWLMPEFWQFPTVSMGLGPIMAIYHARFLKYLHNRGLVNTEQSKVWAFLGDGETDEPETLGAIGLASREKLDNLIFVINCNLQRLDGPVRGNGKIVQELEGAFRGEGWNVIKVLWGGSWDPLLAQDPKGLLRKRMEEAVDGEYQNFKNKGGAYTRAHFFGKYPELLNMVSNMTDDEIWKLKRGGHDFFKVYAGYHAAVHHRGQPTVLLVKTVKGFGMGASGEAANPTHQQKKMSSVDLYKFRDRFHLPLTDEQVDNLELFRPDENSEEMKYLRERRQQLGGYLPTRRVRGDDLKAPELSMFERLLQDTGEREMSTTQALVQAMTMITRDKALGPRLVPIVPDEARTFGMEGMFRQIGIYAHEGQKYEPVDRDQLMYYREDQKGQLLEEGINEAGAMSSWIAAATTYSTTGYQMIPVYIFYSMFGFQRIGDLAWAAGDMQARGFLIGGTSGRTTLNGEGLQHEDGHSQILAANIPNCVSYDPTFAYEVAVIFQNGIYRMNEKQENVFFYITTLNENYHHPSMPAGQAENILKGMYPFRKGDEGKRRVQLLGSGAIFNEVIAAANLLATEWDVQSDLWSCPSFNELYRDCMDVERWNRLHPDRTPRRSHVESCLAETQGPVIAATDYVKRFADQIRACVPRRYVTLGTDGFGRSDLRKALRSHFEVDRYHIVVAALKALADDGELKPEKVAEAIQKYGVNADKLNPLYA
jgi:pyruvate dehydrogenase E1 component